MKITVIGAGNMGGAIARALAAASSVRHEIVCTARSSETLASLSASGFSAISDNRKAVEGADIVIFAVKPWLMEDVVRDVAPCLDLSNQVVASVAAGITFEQLTQWFDGSPAMFRIIPNTAIEVGSGVTFISSCNASSDQRAMVLDMFSQMGYALEVEESMMAAGTALASCGIAYAMKYIQASVAGGQALGFSAEESRKIVEHTVKGAADLLLATGAVPQKEIDQVTAPGGMTQKGLAAMEQSGFSRAVTDGLNACLK